MYSNIQSINSTPKPLETEATDARLRKGKHTDDVVDQEHEKHQKSDYGQDSDHESSIFSINALICFLEDFLEARLSSKLNEAPSKDASEVSSFAPWMKEDHSNANEKPNIPANRAANAYAHGADTLKGVVHKGALFEQEHHLNNDSVSDVYHLLRDLRDLREGGQKQLKLDNNLTFMDGVYSAVQVAKLNADQR